ncbi:uncharacterized protein M6B38_269480 [Iris pallida]|uniref:Uncharacterized protein n=1 Tax=Iris pallida TaxID=29817 RepID=A0AAX6EDE6_IRIPA|nr:uncharacterized protein M6B38_195175 [Iris pallida]KAJ6849227.1 uncharacterized protein M6B38_269480 [Iris pallida]
MFVLLSVTRVGESCYQTTKKKNMGMTRMPTVESRGTMMKTTRRKKDDALICKEDGLLQSTSSKACETAGV